MNYPQVYGPFMQDGMETILEIYPNVWFRTTRYKRGVVDVVHREDSLGNYVQTEYSVGVPSKTKIGRTDSEYWTIYVYDDGELSSVVDSNGRYLDSEELESKFGVRVVLEHDPFIPDEIVDTLLGGCEGVPQ